MGFMDKLMFWKKHDDFGDLGNDFGSGKDPFATDPSLGSDPGLGSNPGLGNPQGFGQDEFGGNQQLPGTESLSPAFGRGQGYGQQKPGMPQLDPVDTPSYGAAPVAQVSHGMEKEIELISVKLDSIRNTLEILNQRVSRIERIAEAEQQQTPSRWV